MKVNNVEIQYKFTSRREGDFAVVIADNTKAKELLNGNTDSCEIATRTEVYFYNKNTMNIGNNNLC